MLYFAKNCALVVFLLLVGTCGPATAQVYKTRPLTLLLGAFNDEVKLLEQTVEKPRVYQIHGIKFTRGKLHGRDVVIALTGVGKVNAAMTTTLALQYFRPAEVLFTGIAGGLNPDLQPGDIVIGGEVAHHDFGYVSFQNVATRQTRNPISGEFNPAFFPADSALLAKTRRAVDQVPLEAISASSRVPRVMVGRIVTGDVFVSSEEKVRQLRTDYQADATEMEGAAVAQICWQQQVPCLVIRSLSDKADGTAREDMLRFVKVAARNSAALVQEVVRSIR
ncbi:5'-methylthioadenosine/adenosylhomocysteine nucleosidase [Rhabdobacter roseus]|uniref:adenosylhomocysteine nucleosidase n=1 Tax=Rhabdobacter roseus TaxID=1655419 RepID=A0A840U195_9BACT|nr:5'-methylthioadenosine/adenosylhomocysteine nucleosidase [Rhabdobacter roseus]MBB5287517.1 adenosylhomocysteine nucleosidase [Rhabdobacter roseus]